MYYHPPIKSHEPVMIPLTDTIWNICYDPNRTVVQTGDITISSQCEVDSTRRHTNLKVK